MPCFITRRATLGQGDGSTRNIPYLSCIAHAQNGGNGGIALNGGVADGASGSTNSNVNAGNDGIAIGPGSVADGTSGNANGNGQVRSVAINGGDTHQGCTDAIGSMCFNPP